MKKLILSASLIITTYSWAQTTPKVDFTTASASIRFDLSEHLVIGEVTYQFQVNEMTDSIKIDAKNMMIQGIKLNGQTPKYRSEERRVGKECRTRRTR